MVDVFPPSRQPMRGFVDRLFGLEKPEPGLLSLSVVHGLTCRKWGPSSSPSPIIDPNSALP
jgi:microcystin degradation protein MlrC